MEGFGEVHIYVTYLLSHFVMDFKFSFLTVVLFRVIAVDF